MAVYTDIADDDLNNFVADYGIGTVQSYHGIAEGVENSNFLVRTDQGSYILTLYEKRVDPADLPFFLGLMEHLADHGVICPLPLKTRDGTMLRTLCDRPAAMVSFLTGAWPRHIKTIHCAEVGTALARLHKAGANYTRRRANALSLGGWQSLAAATLARADEVQPGLADTIADELDYLAAHWPAALPQGVIHADLFPDNVFFIGEQLSGLIDFYFACNDALAYDLAIAVNAWCFEADGALNVTRARAMVQRYEAERPLSEAEKSAFPLLARGGALRFLLTRLYDWLNHPPGALVTPKNPLEYLAKLRFHQGVRHLSGYGL